MAPVEAHEYVRVCPVCETENPPARARCECGASLAGVDFSLKRPPAPDTPAAIAEAPAPAPSPEAGTVCPHPDCAQPNPPGRDRCVYCNRSLHDGEIARSIAGARPLPAALRNDYTIVDVFAASGSEADILLVESVATAERRVVKLYRKGIQPDFRLLDILARTVGDTVVRVLAHGTSEGVAYEVLEYVPGGTLKQLLESGPLPLDDVRRIVSEIAEALRGIHAHRILHRDLKPENVLLRSKAPLELALTDFGIASIAAATQHFTGGARTTKYAAPEVLTGVLDDKSDWWSLGMIALEGATGRHPFDGLTEQVMNHHLATRPIDVRGVYDDRLRMLCRGLLLRDPKRRWGSAEVARWLDGDETLAVPDDAEGPAKAVRPYRIGTTECTTAAELAVAMTRHWDEARKDLARGQIARWLEHELNDYNLVRKLRDIEELRGTSDDARLLRFLLAAAPDLPPVWRGMPVGHDVVYEIARRAEAGDEGALAWLDSVFREGVLAQFAAAGRGELAEIDRIWRDAWTYFLELWQAARVAEEKWRMEPRAVAGAESAKVVSFDDLAYAAPARLSPPPQRAVNAALLLARHDAAYVDALRGEIVAGLGEIASDCPWYEALWEKAQRDAVGVLVAHRLLPHARDDALMEGRRQAASDQARARIAAEARDELRTRVAAVLAIAPEDDGDIDHAMATELLDALEPFQQACQQILRLGFADPDSEALRRVAEKLSALGLSAQRALADCEQVRGVNAIFLRPERLMIGAVVFAIALVIRVPWVLLAVLVAVALGIGYRWYMGFRATETALARLKLLRLHGRAFLRDEEH